MHQNEMCAARCRWARPDASMICRWIASCRLATCSSPCLVFPWPRPSLDSWLGICICLVAREKLEKEKGKANCPFSPPLAIPPPCWPLARQAKRGYKFAWQKRAALPLYQRYFSSSALSCDRAGEGRVPSQSGFSFFAPPRSLFRALLSYMPSRG